MSGGRVLAGDWRFRSEIANVPAMPEHPPNPWGGRWRKGRGGSKAIVYFVSTLNEPFRVYDVRAKGEHFEAVPIASALAECRLFVPRGGGPKRLYRFRSGETRALDPTALNSQLVNARPLGRA